MNADPLDDLMKHLNAQSDDAYRKFNERLLPGFEGKILGVRMPVLRKLSREILKSDPIAFLDVSLSSGLHELRMLHALVLASLPCPFDDRLHFIERFVPVIDNWSVCDTLCTALKPRPEHLDALLPFLERCLLSKQEFEVRFGCVMLMLYYASDAYVDHTLDRYAHIRHEGYYARMAVAWGLSDLFVHQREKTLRFLKYDALDPFTHNKAIQKCIESYRISNEDKQLLRTLRR